MRRSGRKVSCVFLRPCVLCVFFFLTKIPGFFRNPEFEKTFDIAAMGSSIREFSFPPHSR